MSASEPENTEFSMEIKVEPAEPAERLNLIPFIEHVKPELESQDEEENESQLPEVGEKVALDEEFSLDTEALEVEVKMETDFEVAEERSELKVLQDKFREEIAESLNKSGINIKSELPSDAIIEYDYPQFSMDSADSGINKTDPELQQNNADLSYHCKRNMDFSATETHLITNKLINSTSTVTRPQDGVRTSQTTNTLIMEIIPVNRDQHLKDNNEPEEILPTITESTLKNCKKRKVIKPLKKSKAKAVIEENYMLNSITSNMMPLEQYALQDKLKQFMCTQCPKSYRSKASLVQHLTLHESLEFKAMKKKIGKKKKMFEVKDLVYKAKVKVERNVVMKKKTEGEEYKCTCGKSYYRRTRLETCWRSHSDVCEERPSYNCGACKKNFKNERELISHNRNIHIRRKFPCKFCPAEFHIRKQLFKHLRLHRKLQLAEYHVMSDFIKKKHKKIKCFICKKTYPELIDLKVHVSSEHTEEIACSFCKTNMKFSELIRHFKKKHKDKVTPLHELHEAYYKLTEAWRCEECLLPFYKADEFAVHRVEKHSSCVTATVTESEQFQCNDCQRVFTSAKSLNSHSRIHHQIIEKEEPQQTMLLCVYCRKVCTEDTLESHMRFHSLDRKFPCKYCDYRFGTSEKRKKHAEIHTGNLKFICFICEYRCSSEHRLDLHKMSAKHQSMKEHLLQGKALPSESTTKMENVRDDNKNSTSSSEESSNSGSESDDSAAEVICDICGDKFSSKAKMLEHKQTHPFIEFPNEDNPTRIFFK